MNERDRSAVLYAASYGPVIGVKVLLKYLQLKRAARRGEKRFYHELIRSGLSRPEAKYLASEYGSAVSIRNLVSASGRDIPFLNKL